ncbi:MAG: TolC family protein [bacterium]|jgi:outer membrane protein
MRVFVPLVMAALALPVSAQQAQQQPAQAAEQQQPAQSRQTLQVPEASALVQAESVEASSPAFPRASYFKQRFMTPSTRVELRPPVRLQDFVHNGQLELSLRDYLELVLANNTDIALQRLTIERPKNAIERAFSVFDPAFVGTFSATREKTLPTRLTDAAGEDIVNQLRQNARFAYTQTLQTGTSFEVAFTGGKNSSSDALQLWNPTISTSLSASISQPLLRNRGMAITRLPISVARSTFRRSEYQMHDQILSLIAAAENAYWDVIDARENLKVQQEYFRLQGEFLKRSERELELGAISKLDIYQPQQSYAAAEIQVSRYKYILAQREDALRRYIGADLDPQVRNLPLNLTETVMPPENEEPIDAEAAVARALARRPDLKASLQNLDIDDLNIKSAANMLRPDLSLNLGYTTKGRGGIYYDRSNVFGSSVLNGVYPGGFGDAMSQLFGRDAPAYTFGVTLRLPIRDRRAAADMADALVAKKQDALNLRSLEQRIRLDVLNSISQLESAKAGIELARRSVEFARLRADAEQRKYDLGTTVAYFVLQAQADLANAESSLVQQIVAYQRARVNMLRNTGELLEDRGIILQ